MNKTKPRTGKRTIGSNPAFESRSLAKGLQILEVLSKAGSPMPLKDLAETVGLGKASTLRLLRTLRATGYLVRDGNENYGAEGDWLAPSGQHLLRMIRDAALPVLRVMNAEFGETVALAFLFEDHIRVAEVIESVHHIRMSNHKGRILQAYASSLGKSIAAFQTPERVQTLLHTYGIFRLTPSTLTDLRAILDDLAAIRERGYSWDREETVPGGRCVGAPIHGPKNEVHAAISISMPKDRFTPELEALLPERIVGYAEQIARALGSSEKADSRIKAREAKG